MTIDSAVFLFAGIVNLLGLVLAVVFSPYWLILCALVGFNMIQTSFTGFCPPAILFKKLGMKPGPAFFKSQQ
ncbi:MAG: DUF2892 domain-containing protein [Alphaproteobacteria bacterium]|nr:DUF2892 domain-containing protein [Alphaproteobacteria bacterium]